MKYLLEEEQELVAVGGAMNNKTPGTKVGRIEDGVVLL